MIVWFSGLGLDVTAWEGRKEVNGLYKKEFVDVLMCVMCRAFCSGQEQDTKMIALLCLCGCSTGFGNGSCKMVGRGKSRYMEKEAAKAWVERNDLRLRFCNSMKQH